jgi:hypothetical protein
VFDYAGWSGPPKVLHLFNLFNVWLNKGWTLLAVEPFTMAGTAM